MKLFIRAHDLGVKGIDQVVDKLNYYGLDGVQLVAYKVLDGVTYTKDGITPQIATEVGNKLAQAGKTIPLVGAYFNPVHSNSAKVQLSQDVFRSYVDVLDHLGADCVGSETGSFNDDKWTYHPQNRTDEALQTVIETFGGLAKYAQQQNKYIAMEGAFGHVCYSPERLKQAVDAINMPNVKIIFDLYNYLDISNVQERYDILRRGLQLFGKNITVFHIKDCVVQDGKLVQCPVGKGIFDYDQILQQIYKVQPEANLVFEGTVGDDIASSVEFIKQRLQKL